MLVGIRNTPREYAWGSIESIARLQGRAPTGLPEAEVWFGDHPGSPAVVEDGSGLRLDAWLAARGDAPLPYLLKLLAAAAPLSIQAHPSKAQAVEGFEREERAGIPVDAPGRNYRDANHKPEVIVALSDRFEALAGLRPLPDTLALLDGLPPAPAVLALRERLAAGDDAARALRDTIAWLLEDAAPDEIAGIVDAVRAGAEGAPADSPLRTIARIAEAAPGDPGVVVALLMNVVVLGRGEAIFVPAGVLHAYLDGLGVELMAASDNVLRGGLTPKHIDVPELMRVLDPTPGEGPVLPAVPVSPGVSAFAPAIPDFLLLRATSTAEPTRVPVRGPAIVLAVAGPVRVAASDSGDELDLAAGEAAFATADERELVVTGEGEVFLAMPGRS